MLLNLILGGNLRALLIGTLLGIPAVIICLSLHEAAHGLAAFLMGDRTAQASGRLTLDPMAHIDPAGFLCMLLLGFGWARPVPVNFSSFKNRRLGISVTAVAGPLANFILSFVTYFLMGFFLFRVQNPSNFLQIVYQFLGYIAALSAGLGIFNLLPVHPLDGSRILDAILPFGAQLKYQSFMRRYGSIILLIVIALIWYGGLDILVGGTQSLISSWALRLAQAVFA